MNGFLANVKSQSSYMTNERSNPTFHILIFNNYVIICQY